MELQLLQFFARLLRLLLQLLDERGGLGLLEDAVEGFEEVGLESEEVEREVLDLMRKRRSRCYQFERLRLEVRNEHPHRVQKQLGLHSDAYNYLFKLSIYFNIHVAKGYTLK